MALTIASREVDGVTVLDLSGRITLGEGSVQLRDAIRDLISKGSKNILVDLGDVNYIDSSGLGELVSAYTTSKNQGAALKLLKLTKKVHDFCSSPSSTPYSISMTTRPAPSPPSSKSAAASGMHAEKAIR